MLGIVHAARNGLVQFTKAKNIRMGSIDKHHKRGQFAPNEIFKYMGAHGIDFLRKRLMRMTLAKLTNDPHELKRSIANSDNTMSNPDSCLLCFSEVPDSIPMWAYYADNLTGMVIGFDRDHNFFNGIRNVTYHKNRPSYCVTENYQDSLYIKSDRWKHERELRIIKSRKECTKILDQQYTSELQDFPADPHGHDDSVNYMIEVPAEAITSITVSLTEFRFKPQQEKELVEVLSSDKALKHVTLFGWTTNPDNWDLEIGPHPDFSRDKPPHPAHR